MNVGSEVEKRPRVGSVLVYFAVSTPFRLAAMTSPRTSMMYLFHAITTASRGLTKSPDCGAGSAHLIALRHAGHAHQRQSGTLDGAGRQHHHRAAIAVAGDRAAEVERAVAGVDAAHFLHGRAGGERVAARGQTLDVTVRYDHQPLGGIVWAGLAECRARRRDASRHAAGLGERGKS